MAGDTLTRVRETAAAYADAVRDTQRYVDHIEDTRDPGVIAEYAHLVRREEAAAADRLDALTAARVRAGSIDGTDE